MKRIELIKVNHNVEIGQDCPYIEPNITEDSIFYENGEAVGFYIKSMPDKISKIADLANHELRSNRVPKSEMKRSSGLKNYEKEVLQYSTIIGSIPPKPQMRRPYASLSSVHSVKTAQTFIKAMLMLAKESEDILHDIMPEQYNKQIELFKQVPDKWKFSKLFTSSISNYNIPAAFHRDTGNIVGAVNVIITKRLNSKGGNLHVPDYNATMDSADNSLLVYPAWRNVHGVTPIIPTFEGGYRNSLVFYPLKAFINL